MTSFGAFARVLAAEVGDAVFGDEHLHRVFAVVHVRAHRDDGGDVAILGGGRAGEDGDVGVAGEVPGAADAVHHLLAEHVGGVDVAEDIGFERGVDGDDADAADDFRVVGDFLRAQQQAAAEEVEIVIHALQHGIGDGEGNAADKRAAVLFDEFDDRILDDLRIHLEARDFRVVAHGSEHGVGDVADTGLDGQETFRDVAVADFRSEELGDVEADPGGDIGDGSEILDLVRAVGVDDADDFLRIDPDALGADAVIGVADRDRAAVGRRCRFVDVVEAQQFLRVAAVDLDEDAFRLGEEGGSGADAGGEKDLAIHRDIGGLDDGPVELAEESVADVLRQQRKVHVEEVRLAGVDAGAQVLVGLIGRAELDGVRLGECAIERGAGGGAGDDADLEIAARLVFGDGLSAMAVGMTLAAPAGVNPLKPMISSCLTKAAASSGVRMGNGLFMRWKIECRRRMRSLEHGDEVTGGEGAADHAGDVRSHGVHEQVVGRDRISGRRPARRGRPSARRRHRRNR